MHDLTSKRGIALRTPPRPRRIRRTFFARPAFCFRLEKSPRRSRTFAGLETFAALAAHAWARGRDNFSYAYRWGRSFCTIVDRKSRELFSKLYRRRLKTILKFLSDLMICDGEYSLNFVQAGGAGGEGAAVLSGDCSDKYRGLGRRRAEQLLGSTTTC